MTERYELPQGMTELDVRYETLCCQLLDGVVWLAVTLSIG
jgi:hypothetical protein